MSYRNALFSMLVAAAAASACAPVSEGAGTGDPLADRTVLVVENNNWADMTLYVVRGNVRSRVGAVPALGKSRFVLPSTLVAGISDIQLLADPIGSRHAYLSPPIPVFPGQEVHFRLENNVQLSSYSIR